MTDWFIIIGIVFYFLFIIYAANKADAGLQSSKTINLFFYSLVGFMFLTGIFSLRAVMIGVQPENEDLRSMINPLHAGGLAILALTAAIFCYGLVRHPALRVIFARYVRGYNPNSYVHLAATLLSLTVLILNIFNFVVSGGLSGLAESIENTEVFSYNIFFETFLFISVSVVGVGYMTRRTTSATLARLGLRAPTRQDILWGIGTGFGVYILSVTFVLTWQQLSDQETFAQQTEAVQQLSNQIRTIPQAFFMAAGAAFGEEIFTRGALQPVFGVWLTSAFFALLHNQYLLTPTMLFIFVLGMIFGHLRWRMSTTSAIIAHFVYNFMPSVLLILLGGAS